MNEHEQPDREAATLIDRLRAGGIEEQEAAARILFLESELSIARQTIADLRELAYERAPKSAAEELQRQKEHYEAALAEARRESTECPDCGSPAGNGCFAHCPTQTDGREAAAPEIIGGRQKLISKEYRDAYVRAHISTGLRFQLRTMRIAREWTQTKLAEVAGMQPNIISRHENGCSTFPSIPTLLRFASAFDTALLVKFVPFSRLIDECRNLSPQALNAVSFDDDSTDAAYTDARITELEAELASADATYQRLMDNIRLLEDRASKAEAEAGRLRDALQIARQTLSVACGETAPYIKIALGKIDEALAQAAITGADEAESEGKE
jgi:transcriptional regulator with XRE-family HTH domain